MVRGEPLKPLPSRSPSPARTMPRFAEHEGHPVLTTKDVVGQVHHAIVRGRRGETDGNALRVPPPFQAASSLIVACP